MFLPFVCSSDLISRAAHTEGLGLLSPSHMNTSFLGGSSPPHAIEFVFLNNHLTQSPMTFFFLSLLLAT